MCGNFIILPVVCAVAESSTTTTTTTINHHKHNIIQPPCWINLTASNLTPLPTCSSLIDSLSDSSHLGKPTVDVGLRGEVGRLGVLGKNLVWKTRCCNFAWQEGMPCLSYIYILYNYICLNLFGHYHWPKLYRHIGAPWIVKMHSEVLGTLKTPLGASCREIQEA